MLWLYLHFLYAIKAYVGYIWNGRTCIMPVSESELFCGKWEWNYENISISERKRDCASVVLLDFLSSSRSYYLAVSNLFYIFLRLTPYSSGKMSVVYIISSKDSKFSQLANFIISYMFFVQASQHHEMSLYEGKIKKRAWIWRWPCVRHENIRWRWVVSFMPWLSYLLGKISWFLLSRRLVGPRSWPGDFGGDKYLALYPKSNNDSVDNPFCPSYCTDYDDPLLNRKLVEP